MLCPVEIHNKGKVYFILLVLLSIIEILFDVQMPFFSSSFTFYRFLLALNLKTIKFYLTGHYDLQDCFLLRETLI